MTDRCEICGEPLEDEVEDRVEVDGKVEIIFRTIKPCQCTPADKAIWKKLKEIEAKIEKMDKSGYWPWPLPDANAGSGTDSHYTFSAGDTVERNDDQHQSKQDGE